MRHLSGGGRSLESVREERRRSNGGGRETTTPNAGPRASPASIVIDSNNPPTPKSHATVDLAEVEGVEGVGGATRAQNCARQAAASSPNGEATTPAKEASGAAVAARTRAQAMRRTGSKGNKRQLNRQAEEAHKAACVDATAWLKAREVRMEADQGDMYDDMLDEHSLSEMSIRRLGHVLHIEARLREPRGLHDILLQERERMETLANLTVRG